MTYLAVSLSTELERYVAGRTAAEGFADPADFLRDLIQRDQEAYAADVARVQALIEEGIASGVIDAEPEDILRQVIAENVAPHG